jgi:small ligand-binding sensory domain FIST
MTDDPSPSRAARAASAVSGHLDTRTAATEVAYELHDGLGGTCDLAVIFASFHHASAVPEAVETIRQTLDPSTTLAVTTEAVLGHDRELERIAGMSAIAMHLPDVTLTPWMSTPEDAIRLGDPPAIAQRINVSDDLRMTLLLGEPFTTPITRLLPALTDCGGDQPVPVVGGMASGASQPGHNVLVLDDRVYKAGAIGVTIAGRVEVDFVLSQGCRPIGTPMVITGAKSNVIVELGGRPALDVLKEVTTTLEDEEKQLLAKGLLIGNLIDEQKRPFGRGDFLVRSLLGVDRQQGGLLVGDVPRLGQTVQFHARDAVTAEEDLQLLLDAQVLKPPPFGALLFTCNGRGERLFGTPNHDIDIINERIGPVPIAGFFAAGEIGPVGDRSFLHGHTASLALLR